MITLDNKIELFSKLVLDKARGEYKEAMAQLEAVHAQKRQEMEASLEKQGRQYTREMESRAQHEKKKIISRAKGQARKNVLVKKEELFLQLKERLVKEIRRYCETERYPVFLKEKIDRSREELLVLRGELTVICRSSDEELIRHLLREAGLENPLVFDFDDEILGGLTLVDHDRGVKVTMTIDSVIEENTVYLGGLIHDLLREAGELHE